jgi:hypothetical protein
LVIRENGVAHDPPLSKDVRGRNRGFHKQWNPRVLTTTLASLGIQFG